ncbi:MAG: TonB-dependent receptor [Bacteroidetes bacterium]|nr:TonB-dependent receptor [Bacteroidota bacterium]
MNFRNGPTPFMPHLYSLIVLLGMLSFSQWSHAQACSLVVGGQVLDASTNAPIPFANIYLKETKGGTVSDSIGRFSISDLCPGYVHMSVSHIGCDTEEVFLKLEHDTVLSIVLDHNHQMLHEVIVSGTFVKTSTQEMESLSEQQIASNSSKQLAGILEDMTGVSMLKNGGISKPVVHGLYGNRLLILNNGIPQSGQQWGVDHAPEIDPLVANAIRVIKGVNAIEYMGSSLGAVILVEPRRIENDPHLHGKARYFFESNGLGNGLNLQLQRAHKTFSWRVNGSLKKNGDQRAADYFLNNTGRQEANLAIQMERKWSELFFSDLYLSTFNAEFGLLRGSQIGNLTDLGLALEQDRPFFTEENFSYDLEAPSQKVNHHLVKWHSRYARNEKQSLDITYAGQWNLRREFDIRRADRTDLPALSLDQTSHFVELKHQWHPTEDWTLRSGLQLNRIENTNDPETGVLPLIPDYISNRYGLFSSVTRNWNKVTIQAGARYDLEDRNVAAISIDLPRRILRYSDTYSNVTTSGGITYAFKNNLEFSYNIGLASRNPEVNELYSNGLHQGVSGIEEGDPELTREQSIKQTLSLKGKSGERLFFESLVYFQSIQDYIYLNPQEEVRLTIRGAFPVFKYEQTDADLLGADLAVTYRLDEHWTLEGKYSYLRGEDRGNDLPLIFMPANTIHLQVGYQIPRLGRFSNLEVSVDDRYVFEQKRLADSQDFAPPPPGYNLLGLKVSASKQLTKFRLDLYARGENLLNVAYRDYLNRLRYFADDLGVNVTLGVNIVF